jgi:hypothetical protein
MYARDDTDRVDTEKEMKGIIPHEVKIPLADKYIHTYITEAPPTS